MKLSLPLTTWIAVGFLCMHLASEAQANQPDPFFERTVKPFFQTHCLECHSGDNAKASFYMDRLHLDFTHPTNADKWVEAMDAINLGDMPPIEKPQPDPDQVFEVAEWIGSQIRQAQEESRMKGGQVLLRRLNRDEYVNTIIDLLDIDASHAHTLRELLPPDGKADGFDRIAAALFIDETQMEKYLEVASYIADMALPDDPPASYKIDWDPIDGGLARIGDTVVPRGSKSFSINISGGAKPFEEFNNGILSKSPTRYAIARGNLLDDEYPPFSHGNKIDLSEVVREDGFYRFRFFAGAFQGNRDLPVTIRLTYCSNTPLEQEFHHVVQGSIDEPVLQDLVVFLRKPSDFPARFHIDWNVRGDTIIEDPVYKELRQRLHRLSRNLSKAIRQKDSEEAKRLKKEQNTAIP